MTTDWIIPRWMKKYIQYIDTGLFKESLEFFINHPSMHFLENPPLSSTCKKVRAQIDLLTKLYNKGLLK